MILRNDCLTFEWSLKEGVPQLRLHDAQGLPWSDAAGSFLLDLRSPSGGLFRARSLRLLDEALTVQPGGQCLRVVCAPVDSRGQTAPQVHFMLHYHLSADQPVLTEQIEIAVDAPESFFLHRAQWAWRLRKRPGLRWLPVPFGEGHGSHAPTLLTDDAAGKAIRRDGAVFHDLHTGRGLVVAKTPSDRDPEYVVVQTQSDTLSFSGFSPDPVVNDCAAWLQDQHYLSSPTRFELVEGTMEKALTTHRRFMDAHGLGLPADYAPPLNYCIYYECRNHWTLEQVRSLLPLASGLGCTLLYTDQGWETSFGSGVWDTARLGPCAEFTATAAAHGLQVGVLVAQHASTPSWPEHVYRRTPAGTIEDGDQWHPVGICAGSAHWRTEKTERLARLVEDGVSFFSFDFNDAKAYQGFNFLHYACHAPDHDHSRPMSEWEHVRAVARQQREFRERCPEALVEAHDWALAGDSALPAYLFPDSCQERWGFEYMWNPFADLQAGRLHNLYHFNLAYSRPLYLHLDLKNDHPEQLTALWYLASTIRHLGIGNFTALSPGHQQRVRQALTVYLRHRVYFTRGRFFGAGPCVHVHALPGQGAVVACFNDSPEPKEVRTVFAPADLGIGTPAAAGAPESLWGPEVRVEHGADDLSFHTNLPAWGVALVRVPSSPVP